MTKKETEEMDIVHLDLEDLEFLAESQLKDKIKNKEKRKKKVKIQKVEEYFLELGFSPDLIPKKIHKDYPDVFGIKLDKKERDDILSETPGIESTAGLQLYASMLMSVKYGKKA